MKVLVTGVAGFIGSQIAKRLLRDGFEVYGIDDLSTGRTGLIPEGVNFYKIDVSDIRHFESELRDLDFILHLAGQSSGEISFDDPTDDLKRNCISTLDLLRFGSDIGVQKFLHASSMSVYGDLETPKVREDVTPNPKSCYGLSKLAAENYLRLLSSKMPYVCLRMFNVYGPGQDLANLKQGMVSIFLAQALNSSEILVRGSLDRFRDFVYIDDVVEIWCRAMIEPSVNNECFNVGSGRKTSVGLLLQKIIHHFPKCIVKHAGETPGDQFGIYADMSKTSRAMKIGDFVSLDRGLDVMINHYKRVDD